MSQSAQKGKPKRQRANSLNQTPQKYYDNEYTGGGGNNGRKNKSHYQTSGAFSTTKIYTNSSRSAELQTLLNTLPTGAPYSQSHTNKRRGGGYGGENHMSSQNPRKAGGGPHNVSNADDDAVVDDEESNRLNATALRRIDPAFSKLFGTASQVAVYRYNPSTQSWVCLFSILVWFSLQKFPPVLSWLNNKAVYPSDFLGLVWSTIIRYSFKLPSS